MIGELVGSYRVVEPLGEGGMGQVFIAEHTALGKRAAVKVLRPELSQNEEIVTRFFNEAKATTLINHPCIIQVFDFGRLANGSAYFVMECLDGESLGARLRREGRLPSELTVALVVQVVDALAVAHERGIVHRDLKPDNLFLCPDPTLPCGLRVKVLDFGIAKLAEGAGVRTRTNEAMGTPAYMAPEQCRGAGRVDARSDVYSLGCILYQMGAGRTPFVAEGTGDYFIAHIQEAPVPPTRFEGSIPASLERMILRCLAKAPADRYQSMRELAADLAKMPRFSGGPMPAASWSAVEVPPAPEGPPPAKPAGGTLTMPPAAPVAATAGGAGRRRMWIVLAVIGVCAAAGVTIAVARGGGGRGARSPATERAVAPAADAGPAAARAPVDAGVPIAEQGVRDPDAGSRRREKRGSGKSGDGVVIPDEFRDRPK